MSGCGLIMRGCHKSINRAKKDTVIFNDLPKEIKEFFYTIANIRGREKRHEFYSSSENVSLTDRHKLSINEWFIPNLFVFNTTYEYELKTVHVLKSSNLWTSHFLLIDKTNNITYRINLGKFPIIIYNAELFIPTVYNWQLESFDTLNFDRFCLGNFNRRSRKVHGR